jgi:hypothetical protein
MGKVKNNTVTKGFSGKFGEDIVFRQLKNKTYFAQAGRRLAPPTPLQTETRNRFTTAAMYAATALENEEARKMYKTFALLNDLRSSYLAAITDNMSRPEIGSVFTGAYNGEAGSVLSIKPKLKFKVINMTVSVIAPDGSVVETGAGIEKDYKWFYVTPAANPTVEGSKVVIVARDRFRREVTFETAV